MLLAGVDEAEAALKTVTFEKLVAAKGAGPVRDRDLPLVVGRVNKGPGLVSHTTRFQVYTNILSVTAAWVVGTDLLASTPTWLATMTTSSPAITPPVC